MAKGKKWFPGIELGVKGHGTPGQETHKGDKTNGKGPLRTATPDTRTHGSRAH